MNSSIMGDIMRGGKSFYGVFRVLRNKYGNKLTSLFHVQHNPYFRPWLPQIPWRLAYVDAAVSWL